jgi:hypothetical protein
MSRVKNPVEKKRLSLTRDHRTFALEGNKTFRKAWRMKKVKAARQLRRAQGKADRLHQATAEVENVVRKRVRPLKKHGVMSLSQMVSFKGGELGHRWASPVLGIKNKEALKAATRRLRKRGEPK